MPSVDGIIYQDIQVVAVFSISGNTGTSEIDVMNCHFPFCIVDLLFAPATYNVSEFLLRVVLETGDIAEQLVSVLHICHSSMLTVNVEFHQILRVRHDV